jgi:hypothetical protein
VEIDGVRHHRVYSLSAAAADDVAISARRGDSRPVSIAQRSDADTPQRRANSAPDSPRRRR